MNPNMEILTCDPLICTMNHPKFTVSNQMEESKNIKKGKKMFLTIVILLFQNEEPTTCDASTVTDEETLGEITQDETGENDKVSSLFFYLLVRM